MELKEDLGRKLMMERAKGLFIAFGKVTNFCRTLMEQGKDLDGFSREMTLGEAIQRLGEIGQEPNQIDDFYQAILLSENKPEVVEAMSLAELHGEIVRVIKDLAKTLLGVSEVNNGDVEFLFNKFAAETQQEQETLTQQRSLADAVSELAYRVSQASQ